MRSAGERVGEDGDVPLAAEVPTFLLIGESHAGQRSWMGRWPEAA